MGNRLKTCKWVCGSLMFTQTAIMVQKTLDGWFAKIDCEKFQASLVSGPWETQREAEWGLINAFETFSQERALNL